MDEDDFSFVCILVIILVVVSGMSYLIGSNNGEYNGLEKAHIQAVEYDYGDYVNGQFKWKVDIEKENLQKDLEFIKRNERFFRTDMFKAPIGPLTVDPVFPPERIDPTQDF